MLQQTTRQWCHWWFPITSCFGVTNHGWLASLWLVRQDRATINSGNLPAWGAPVWQRSVASLSEIGWLASEVSRQLSILCLWLWSAWKPRPCPGLPESCADWLRTGSLAGQSEQVAETVSPHKQTTALQDAYSDAKLGWTKNYHTPHHTTPNPTDSPATNVPMWLMRVNNLPTVATWEWNSHTGDLNVGPRIH